jgi:hypothetical protein
MGWECFYSGILPDIILQEKVTNFVKTFYSSPQELIVTPDPSLRYLTKLDYWHERKFYEHYMPDYPFNYYGIIQLCDRKDGTIFGGQFIFDRTAGGRLVSFKKLPDTYVLSQTSEQHDKKAGNRPAEFPIELTLGDSVRKIYGFALLLSVIRLRWWPDLKCCDDDDSCQKTFQRIWEYSLARKLMDESLNYNSCVDIMKKEHEKYFPPSLPESPTPKKTRSVLKSVPPGILGKAVSELDLSVRSINGLKNLGIETLGELIKRSERDLFGKFNLGRKSMLEIAEVLGEYGLSLNRS